jgi:hypothetical protein
MHTLPKGTSFFFGNFCFDGLYLPTHKQLVVTLYGQGLSVNDMQLNTQKCGDEL